MPSGLLAEVALRVRCRHRRMRPKPLIAAQNSGERWSLELLDGTISVPMHNWSAPAEGDEPPARCPGGRPQRYLYARWEAENLLRLGGVNSLVMALAR